MKLKQHIYSVTINATIKVKETNLKIKSGFRIMSVPLTDEQALQISKILYPDWEIISVELQNIGDKIDD